MPAETIPLVSIGFGFLLALARISALLAFVPLTAWKGASDAPRILFSLAVTASMAPFWPRLAAQDLTAGALLMRLFAETGAGLALGVATGLLLEAFLLGSQLIGIQAGYSYASTVDPTSQADSSVLQVVAHLLATLLFLGFGMDRYLISAAARGLALGRGFEPGWSQLAALGAAMWTTAIRIAGPILLFLLAVDLVLSCIGRINTQLQLLSVAFPAKILATIALLALLAGIYPPLFRQHAARLQAVVHP